MVENEGIKIVLNGTVVSVKREMTFEELTELAFPGRSADRHHRLGSGLQRVA